MPARQDSVGFDLARTQVAALNRSWPEATAKTASGNSLDIFSYGPEGRHAGYSRVIL